LSDIYFWIVPAKVAGTWQSRLEIRGKPVDYELRLAQRYQSVSGTATVGGRTVELQSAALSGSQLTLRFTVQVDGAPMKHEFVAQVDGGAMNGTADLSGPRLQAKLDWSAKRSSPSASARNVRAARGT
jgi:hypothetical protein